MPQVVEFVAETIRNGSGGGDASPFAFSPQHSTPKSSARTPQA
jgi:hypothetical protein